MTDEERLQTIMSIQGEMATREDALISFMKKRYIELIALSKDRTADADSFEAVLERMDRERNKVHQSLIDKRFQLKQHMSREEWEVVFKMKKNKESNAKTNMICQMVTYLLK